MTLNALAVATDTFGATEQMPVLFIGHGNPMNAIEDNQFSRSWIALGKRLPRPNAILSVSAHWLTQRGVQVTAMDKPKTIHDFGGFPQELFDVQYPAPGSPAFATTTKNMITSPTVGLDYEWGLDHGTWSVMKRLYPHADVPVYQLSIDYAQPAQYHFDLGKQLQALRHKGVLIMGSGNIVHNLREFQMNIPAFDWAIEFDKKISDWINEKNFQPIVDFQKLGALAKRAHPTYDHLLPLLYVLGAAEKKDSHEYFTPVIDAGSISMRTVLFG